MNLLIVGAPGAGKGTMAELIIKEYGIVHVSTGNMLREAIANKLEVGLAAQSYMEKGALVPDSIIHDIILERLSRDDMDKGFMFDGYPRTLNQAEDLDVILKSINKKIDVVINLDIEDEELVKRITGRRLCPKCGEIYNIYSKPSVKENVCDKCGSELTTRKDDNLESLTVRLNEYHHNTEPVLGYYKKMDIVKDVNAKRSANEVFEDIKSILEGIK